MKPTAINRGISIKDIKDGVRVGELWTRSGVVRTPLFMPVGTRGAVKSLSPEQVATTNAQIILGNTYHLHMNPGEKTVAQLGGLHDFMNWSGPILTDSGGFQVFSLGQHRKITEEGVVFKDPKNGDLVSLTPEKAIQIQLDLGSDIIMAFDDVAGLSGSDKNRGKEAFERTHRWLERSLAEFKKGTKSITPENRPLFFGIAQGGLDKKLRKKSIEFVQSLDVDGLAIGGLSVGEARDDMYDLLKFMGPIYDPNLAHYLMGVGDPKDMRVAIENGIDMFDCVLPTRNARHGSAWVSDPCTCATKSSKATFSGASRHTSDISSLRDSVAVPNVPLYRVSQSKFEIISDCKNCGPLDEKIQLTNAKFKADKTVIDESCDCYTCKLGFSKGFLRHQFQIGETLAGSLTSIHNIRYLERLCEEYRVV